MIVIVCQCGLKQSSNLLREDGQRGSGAVECESKICSPRNFRYKDAWAIGFGLPYVQ